MIATKLLTKVEEFKNIKSGDILVVEWKLDSYKEDKRTRFASYEVYKNLTENGYPEIVLQKKNNVYFNYNLFCRVEEGCSNAERVMLVFKEE